MSQSESNDPSKPEAPSSEPEPAAQRQLPYHKPALTHYGSLAELTQHNPSLGSDGGVADCQHP